MTGNSSRHRGKQTVDRDEAFARVQAAVDAHEAGADILIMAPTDANATEGFDKALERARGFAKIGADITFLEAPRNEEQMRARSLSGASRTAGAGHGEQLPDT